MDPDVSFPVVLRAVDRGGFDDFWASSVFSGLVDPSMIHLRQRQSVQLRVCGESMQSS